MMVMRPPLTSLQQSGILSPLDVHLAELLRRVTKEDRWEVLFAIALASQWPQRGHVCLDLKELTLEDLWENQETFSPSQTLELPEFSHWLEALESSEAIGRPGDTKPCILWEDRLYLYRYWKYEDGLSRRLRQWLCTDVPADDDQLLESSTSQIFAKPFSEIDNDLQMKAAWTAARQSIFVLTGGPGTGKTTTVLRLLAVMIEQDSELRIALAAPTGKAALRLSESIDHGKHALECSPDTVEALPKEAHTLHRLLGFQRHKTTFRYNRDKPLPYDLVVVDEASMMDLPLAAKLVDALRTQARLVLVGDREQLPSVDAGRVFADLCEPESPLPRVELTRNYRFAQDQGIGGLAGAVRQADEDAAIRLLGNDSTRLCPLPPPRQLRETVWNRLQAYLEKLLVETDAEAAFRHLDTVRILCAHRTGPYGSETINQIVHELLTSRLKVDRQARWFLGRPIIVTENDYAAELFNGDTGLVLPWQGKLHVFFRSSGAEPFRRLPPSRLPAHESAFALTVHKCQGSEFDEVALLLTDRPSPLLTRELLYTGITRARNQVEIWSPEESVRTCIRSPLKRTSGLARHFIDWEKEAPS